MLKKSFSFVLCLLAAVLPSIAFGQNNNLLKNSDFEETSASTQKPCKAWSFCIGRRATGCKTALSDDAYNGKKSLKIVLKKSKYPDAYAIQKIKVQANMELRYKLYAKGTPGKKFYVQFIAGKANTLLKHTLTAKWKIVAGKYKVPQNINEIFVAIHMSRRLGPAPAEGYFDQFQLQAADNILYNKRIQLSVNSFCGAGITSFIDKQDGFNYTLSRGMALDIVPGTTPPPGVLANKIYTEKIIVPNKKIQLSRTVKLKRFAGLQVRKTYSIADETSPRVKVNVELENNSKKKLTFAYRVQNIINPADAVISYPFRDWLCGFKRNVKTTQEVNSLRENDLRAGWGARAYLGHKTLLFKFGISDVNRFYCWLGKNLDTMEWYYRQITLQPGEKRNIDYSIQLVESTKVPYDGGINYQTKKVQYIRGLKLPEPPVQRPKIPAIMQGYFPFSACLGIVITPESAGSSDSPPKQDHKGWFKYVTSGGAQTKQYAYKRQIREFAESYFNNFYYYHLFADSFNLIKFAGNEARRYDMTMTLNIQTVRHADTDVKEYKKIIGARLKHRLSPPLGRNTVKKYKDTILCYYTADEISPRNLDCMLVGDAALKEALGEPEAACFPYNNLKPSIDVMAKYLPVYLGDRYPIKAGGNQVRNPWAIGKEIERAVRALPDTIIWFMPQAFGGQEYYAMPTAPEMRMMLYASVGSGAKGVVLYSLNSASSWIVKNGGSHQTIVSGEGARIQPQWDAIVECARELTAIGPRLFYTKPDFNYKDVKVETPNFIKDFRTEFGKTVRLYDGPAVTIHALKHNEGKFCYLMLINQDDKTSQTATVSFPASAACYDLTGMKYIDPAKKFKVTLKPGDARFFISGLVDEIKPEIAQIFTNRYTREKVRYQIKAERAAKNGITVAPVPAGTGESAYKAIIAAQKKLERTVNGSEFGKISKKWVQARKLLSQVSNILVNNKASIVDIEASKKLGPFQRYAEPKDPIIRKVVADINKDFWNYWRLNRAIENGKYKENKEDINKLIEKIKVDVSAAVKKFQNIPKPTK